MRRCRKMISVIMLMVMLVTLLPSGALAAEAPAGGTNGVAAVVEPQSDTEEEAPEEAGKSEEGDSQDASDEIDGGTAVSEDSSGGTSVSDAVQEPQEAMEENEAARSGVTAANEVAAEEKPSEDAGLGLTGVEVAPVEEPVEKEAKAADVNTKHGSILAYAEAHGGTADEKLTDGDGNPVERNSEGYYEVDAGKKYNYEADIYSESFEPGIYTINLPAGYSYTIPQGHSVINIGGVKVGTISVANNELQIVFDEAVNGKQNIWANVWIQFTPQGKDLSKSKIGDFNLELQNPPDTTVKIGKATPRTSPIQDSSGKIIAESIVWTIDVTSGAGATAVGQTVTDEITSSNHQFSASDKAAGVIVTATKGSEKATWTLKGSSDGLTWSGSTGWSYTIPAKAPANATKGAGTAFGNDWDFTFEFKTTTTEKWRIEDVGPAGKKITCYNKGSIDTRSVVKSRVFDSRPGPVPVGTIKKKGAMTGENGQYSYLTWETEVTALNFAATDELSVRDYYMLGAPGNPTSGTVSREDTPNWENISAKITFTKDGVKKTETVRFEDGADTSSVSESGYYLKVIQFKETTDDYTLSNGAKAPTSYFYLYNENHETGSGIVGNATLVINYEMEYTGAIIRALNDNKNSEGQVNNDRYNIYNYAEARKNGKSYATGDGYIQTGESYKRVRREPNAENNYTVTYLLKWMPSADDIEKYDYFILVDELDEENLSFTREDITIWAQENDRETENWVDVEADWEYEDHVLTLKIKNIGRYFYYIAYKAVVNTDFPDNKTPVEFRNKIHEEIDGVDVDIDSIKDTLVHYSVGGSKYKIVVNKTDEQGSPLPGAEITIFTEDGDVFKEKTTGDDGQVVFETNVKDDIVYKRNTPYYVQETAAPANYELDDTKYWFVFSVSGADGYQEDSYWAEYFGDKEYKIIKGDTSAGQEPWTGEFAIVNEIGKISIPVEKVWDDQDNEERPDSVTVKLLANNADTGESLVLNETNEWKGTFTDLAKNDAEGNPITYTVSETAPSGYTVVISGSAENGFVVTNTLIPKTTATVKKVWNDAEDQDGKRPESLTVTLNRKVGETTAKVQDVTLPVDGEWEATVEDLPEYENGVKIEYSWAEDETGLPAGYTLTGNTTDGTVTTLTNSYTPEKTTATVKKVWNDNNNQDGKRPASLTVTLSNGANVILNESNKWTATVENLPKYKNGVEIEYTWTEDEEGLPAGYSLTGNSKSGTITTLTNSYTPGKTTATVKKVWDDAEDQDDKRPESLTVTLNKKVGETTTKVQDVTLPVDGEWEATVEDLPIYENGVEIEYSWAEDETGLPEGYALTGNSKSGTITTLTNSYTPEETEATVKKVWNDNNNQDGKRPESLEVTLSNGTKVTLNEANSWTATVDKLPKYKNGVEIEYTWTEDEEGLPAGYTLTGNSKSGTITTLTNSYTPEETEATVKKIWDDKNNQDGKRPESLEVTLSNGTKVTLNEANSWTATVDKLPKYENGVEIVYTWTEGTMPEGYSLSNTSKNGTVTSLTNTYNTEQRSISVTKVWKDDNDMDKVRPEEITVQLYADGSEYGDAVTLKESEGWTYTWTGLDKYKEGGTEIRYTVDEASVPDGYVKVSVDGGMTTGYIITNKHDERPVSISKVDITGSEEVAGATLQVLLNNEVVTGRDAEGNDARLEWESTEGAHTIYGLTPGVQYTLRETIEPAGYTIAADTTFTIIVNEEGEFQRVESSGTVTESNVVLVKDAPTKVNIRKVDAANQKELPGATLKIIDPEENVFKEWTSTEEDYVVTGLTAGVEYKLVETVAPLGFTVTSETKFSVNNKNEVTYKGETVSLKENGVPVILVEDTMTKVSISKTDITGEKELKGATLQILDEDENVVTVKDHDGNDVKCEWTSTDKPHVVEGLPTGKTYTLRETIAPDGYTIATDATFSIDENNRITYSGKKNASGVLLVEDKPTKVKVSKVDITGEKELQGAKLQILDADEKVVEIKDNDGKVVEKCEWESGKEPKEFTGLKTGTVYTLRETIAPDGYTIATDFQFTIGTDGKVTTEGKTTTAEDGTTVLLVEDEPTKLYVSKQAITGDEELPGATLQILDKDGNVVVLKDNDGKETETLEWVSGEEPKYIEGLPTGVEYTLRETISPDGYTIASDTKFTIDEKGKVTSDGTTSTSEDGTDVTTLVVKDDLTTVQISKVDTESGAELEGAKIQIIDEEGKVVEEWTSTKEVHVVRGLVAGKKYILREQVAPLGYTLTSDTTFSIDMNNVVTSTGPVNKDGVILVGDSMTEVEILKVDSKTGKGLAGAKLQVLDDNGVVCEEWTSTRDAHKIRGLYTGVTFTLHEVSAPKGYDKAKDITFSIDANGKITSAALENGKIVMKDTPTPSKNKTGDEANGGLWALLLMMAGGALGGTVWFRRRRKI